MDTHLPLNPAMWELFLKKYLNIKNKKINITLYVTPQPATWHVLLMAGEILALAMGWKVAVSLTALSSFELKFK